MNNHNNHQSSSDNNPQAGQGRPLPKKESDLLKSVVKHYESKQYKKGIKSADGILKKFPNHGETLCMKGLTLNGMGKRDEAHALVKRGLTNDMRSHVCWHVYGLLHRSDRQYNPAIKAYKQALRIDPENIQILRDLSLLQIQMRDLPGFLLTRHTILTLKPNAKMNWLSFALAKHLNGDGRGAVKVIDIYLGTLGGEDFEAEMGRGFEAGELMLYRNEILGELAEEEGKGWEEALGHLEECRSIVVDEGAWGMMRGSYELFEGRFGEAEETFLGLFRRGAEEDYRTHSGFMCAVLKLDFEKCKEALNLKGMDNVATVWCLDDEQRQKLLTEYRDRLLKMMPNSQAVRKMPLMLLEAGDELKQALDKHCRRSLTRGVPSLGLDLSFLFVVKQSEGRYRRVTDPLDIKRHPKYQNIVDLVDGYISNLKSCSKFHPSDETEESPSTLLWAWYLRAILHELCNEFVEAIALTDSCLEHTPTAVDVYELKARLLKSGGDIDSAADCLDEGRELDKQDRYINNQTTKYMLMAGRESVAKDRIALFTRHEGNPEQNLYDMQCTWYELELAECLARKGQYGRSLKKFVAVEKHFEDFHEDQFDFHSYCIRKVTLRSYTQVLRFEDELWSQPYYGRAARGIILNYLHLHDNPSITHVEAEPDYSNMTPKERKKAKAIARKKKKKAEKVKREEEDTREEGDEGAKGGKKSSVVVDEDPTGEELLKRDALVEAAKYSASLVKNAPRRFETWILRYDVAIRRSKMLMALQALFKAKAMDPNNSQLFSRTVHFCQKALPTQNPNPSVAEVISTESATLLENQTLSAFVKSTFDKVKSDPDSDLSMKIAVAKAIISTDVASVDEACELIIKGGLEGRGVSVDACREGLSCLDGFEGEVAAVARGEWFDKVKVRFPMIKNFK